MKKFLLLLLTVFSSLIGFSTELNVYTSRHYDVDNLLYKEFTKETGIKVNVYQNKDVNAVIQKLVLEGKDSPADVFLTVGVGDLYNAKKKGILRPISSPIIDKNVPKTLKDKDNYWTGISYRARIFVYDPNQVNTSELSTYEDLANPKWKGKVLTRSSSSSYNKHLIAFLIAKDGEAKTKVWIKGLVENFAREPKGNDRDQAKTIVKGTGAVAIINSYYMGKMSASKDPFEREVYKKLKMFFPNQNDGGTHINLSGIGVTASSKNLDAAIKFVEFLTSPKAQEIITNANYEYPVNPTVPANATVKSWGDFKKSNIDFDKIGENMDKAQKDADEGGFK